MLKIWIKSIAYFLISSYFSGGMSGTVLSDFMKSTTSAEFHLDCVSTHESPYQFDFCMEIIKIEAIWVC